MSNSEHHREDEQVHARPRVVVVGVATHNAELAHLAMMAQQEAATALGATLTREAAFSQPDQIANPGSIALREAEYDRAA